MSWGVLSDADAQTKVDYPTTRDLTGYTKVGTLRDFVNNISSTTYGRLEAGESAYLSIALKMLETADNTYQGLTLGAFDIHIIATQEVEEDDAFDNTYDQNAQYPLVPGVFYTQSTSVVGLVDAATGKTTRDITLGGFIIPEGTKIEEGATELTLNQKYVAFDNSEAIIEANVGELISRMDIHVDGVAADNDKPIIVPVEKEFPKNLSKGNIRLVHVENGITVPMVQVDSMEELDAHNEFYYDAATGKVTVSLATFSEVTAIADTANPWNGTVNTSWYNTEGKEFTLTTAEQFAGFAQIVGGMADGIDAYYAR